MDKNIYDRLNKIKIMIAMMSESDLKGELSDSEIIELKVLKQELHILENFRITSNIAKKNV
jgi:hypothetical protein